MSPLEDKSHIEAVIRDFDFYQDYSACRDIWMHVGEGVQLSRSDDPEEILKKIQRDPDLFLIAEVGEGEIAGTVIGGFDGRRGIVYHLAVLPHYQHRGIASLLMNELESRLLKKGCIRCYLLVVPTNRTAISFYEKRGWNLMNVNTYGKDISSDD